MTNKFVMRYNAYEKSHLLIGIVYLKTDLFLKRNSCKMKTNT